MSFLHQVRETNPSRETLSLEENTGRLPKGPEGAGAIADALSSLAEDIDFCNFGRLADVPWALGVSSVKRGILVTYILKAEFRLLSCSKACTRVAEGNGLGRVHMNPLGNLVNRPELGPSVYIPVLGVMEALLVHKPHFVWAPRDLRTTAFCSWLPST